MRTERRLLGTRVRVMMNRFESREAARAAVAAALETGRMSARTRLHLEAALALPRAQLRVFLGRHRGEGTAGVLAAELEAACRALSSAQGTEVPEGASFRVSTGEDGQLIGAAFQWWTLGDG
jgi:hypothetical protein